MQVGSIYILIEPQSNEIRYVGKTAVKPSTRLYKHHYEGKTSSGTSHRTQWLCRQMRLGYPPIMEIVCEIDLPFIDEAEIFWISHYRERGCNLVNHHIGGNGGWEHRKGKTSPRKGVALSDEIRQQISNALSGRKLPQITRDRMSAARQRDRNLIAEKTAKAWEEGKFARNRQPEPPEWWGSLICPVCDKGPFKSFHGTRKHMTQTACDAVVHPDGYIRYKDTHKS